MDNFYVKLEEEEESRKQKYMIIYLKIGGSYELKSLSIVVCMFALLAFGLGISKETKILDLNFYLCLLLSLSASVYLWVWAADNSEKVKLDEELNLNGARLANLLLFASAAFNSWLAFYYFVQTRFADQLPEGLQLSRGAVTAVAVLLGLTTLCQLRSLYLMAQVTWNELDVSGWVFLPAGVVAIYSGVRILYSIPYWARELPLQTCRVIVVLLLISEVFLVISSLRISSCKSDSVFSSILGCAVLTVLFIGAFWIPCFDNLSLSTDPRTRRNISFSLKHFPLLLVSCIVSLQTARFLYKTHYTARKPMNDVMLKVVFFSLLLTAFGCAAYSQDEPGKSTPRTST